MVRTVYIIDTFKYVQYKFSLFINFRLFVNSVKKHKLINMYIIDEDIRSDNKNNSVQY